MKYQYFIINGGVEIYYFVQMAGINSVKIYGINKDGYVYCFSYGDVKFLRDDEVVAKKLLGEL